MSDRRVSAAEKNEICSKRETSTDCSNLKIILQDELQ